MRGSSGSTAPAKGVREESGAGRVGEGVLREGRAPCQRREQGVVRANKVAALEDPSEGTAGQLHWPHGASGEP